MTSPLVRASVEDWAQRSIRRIAGEHSRVKAPTVHGRKLLVVHLDGVPHQVLQQAVREAKMPFLSRLVQSGAYKLDTAFWGTPASTPAFQGGLMYGLRHPGLPAYNWFDREAGRELRMNQPKDAQMIEERLAARSPAPLFGNGGTSYLSIFHGGANSEVCMATLSELKRLRRGLRTELKGLRGPKRSGLWTYLRSLLKDTWDSAMEISRWARHVGNWKHERAFFVNSFLLLHLGWELAHTRALIDMWKGIPAIYLVFSNYDEFSHRRGPFSPQALGELYRVDSALEELYAMSQLVPEPYDLYFVTDHGHVDSEPFTKRENGARLEPYLLSDEPALLERELETQLRALSAPGSNVLRAPRAPVVVEAGNFAHVYLESGPALEASDILARHRNVLARASSSNSIGIVTLRAGGKGFAIVGGKLYGVDSLAAAPLAHGFSRNGLADYLRELPHLTTAGDLVLYGQATRETGTVGFAWEWGSHGGLTQTEVDSSIFWPSTAPLPFHGLQHSTQLYSQLSELYRS